MEYSEEEIHIDDDNLEEEYEGEIQEPFNPTKIRIAQRTSSLDNLVNRLRHGELDLSPDFQRQKDLWNESAQSRLIESLLVRIPIPAFYFDATDDSKWLVIDGVQRLTALARFVIDEQTLNEQYPELEPLKLCDLEFLMDFNGKTYAELERTYQRRINETQVTVYTIEQGTPADVKYNIFKRINTGGLPLSGQEIRNALNAGKATQLLADLARSNAFLQVIDSSIQDKRGLDQECILRFIAFTLSPDTKYKEYEKVGFDNFLRNAMDSMNKMPLEKLNKLEKTFSKAMEAAYKIFDKSAFRRVSRGGNLSEINTALFEVWSVSLGQLSEVDISKLIEKKGYLINAFQDLMENRVFRRSLLSRARNFNRVKTRFETVREFISTILQEQDPWENIEERYPFGKTVSGQVVGISDARAYIKLEKGVSGWIPPSELSWTKRFQRPKELVSVGDEIDVMILDRDPDKQHLWLSRKRTKPDPWELVPVKYKVGSVVRGKIVKIVPYGAFAKLEEGVEGLIHITRIIPQPTMVEEVVALGEEYDLEVQDFNVKHRRISLTLQNTRGGQTPTIGTIGTMSNNSSSAGGENPEGGT